MKPCKNVNSVDTLLAFRNTIWAFPYVAVMGLIWGYLADASSGAFTGLLIAAATSVLIGKVSTISGERSDESVVISSGGPQGKTAGVRAQSIADLNVVRCHRLCHRFDEALIKIEEVLARDPDFVEALLLKAQILWEGFADANGTKECLLKILVVEPDERAVFHRWALNFYEKLSVGKD